MKKDNQVEEEIRSLRVVINELFQSREISIAEFQFLNNNINSNMANQIFLWYTTETIGVTTAPTTPNSLTVYQLLKEVCHCKLDQLPLHINNHFNVIVKFRLKHGI